MVNVHTTEYNQEENTCGAVQGHDTKARVRLLLVDMPENTPKIFSVILTNLSSCSSEKLVDEELKPGLDHGISAWHVRNTRLKAETKTE